MEGRGSRVEERPRTSSDSTLDSRHSALAARSSRAGVALVITLVLLSIITFMAIAFLVLSEAQKRSVGTTADQTAAQLAADAALQDATARMLASILSSANEFNYDLMVSTNYINARGFDPTLWGPGNTTNVSYVYANGQPLNNPIDLQKNLGNLLYDPRVPVFVTNQLAGSNEFRYYIDLNRNRQFDPTGLLPVLDNNGLPIMTLTNGILVPNYSFAVGDPQWIGILQKPGVPHGPDNRFVSRRAYIVVPTGKTLDINYLYNQAKRVGPLADGFFRNEGVGTWEINLAAFLVDLNTNLWPYPNPNLPLPPDNQVFTPYLYNYVNLAVSSTGTAFDDAVSLLLNRYRPPLPPGFPQLASFNYLFGPALSARFVRSGIDGYSDGPLMTGVALPPNVPADNIMLPWSGADNPEHYFTTQELFDKSKVNLLGFPVSFVDRMALAAARTNSYDHYTYYRLLSQLGTDSAPEPPGKINPNYINIAGFSATNFVSWDDSLVTARMHRPGSELFFTNAVDKMLRALGYNFGVNRIPVYTNNTFVFTPAIHQVLQLAANIYDATTNRTLSGSAVPYPTVFRPVFAKGPLNSVYITDFEEVPNLSSLMGVGTNRDLTLPSDLASLGRYDRVYGVPVVVGARKGLPNFNEFSMQSVSQITRKLTIHRPTLTAPKSQWTTNITYLLGISNVLGVEAWNSYSANYTRPVDIYVTDYLTMGLTTNIMPSANPLLPRLDATMFASLSFPSSTNSYWQGYLYNPGGDPRDPSLKVPLLTNVVFVPESVGLYDSGGQSWTFRTNLNFITASNFFPIPQWGLQVTNRLQYIMVDRETQRVLDYVLLGGMGGIRDLSEEIRDPNNAMGFGGLWSTNRLGGNPAGIPQGLQNQVNVSLGIYGNNATMWNGYGLKPAQSIEWEIDNFRAFYGLGPYYGSQIINTNLDQQVPMSPSKRRYQPLTFQANDPLVHYMAGDLGGVPTSGTVFYPTLLVTMPVLPNLGAINQRYSPWGGNPQKADVDSTRADLALKDPGIWGSDFWDFPANKFPNIGWLGRVHRGTPWQTVYLKASNIGTNFNLWQNWTGNTNAVRNWGQISSRVVFNTSTLPFYAPITNGAIVADAAFTLPVNDRLLLDLFTTALDDNASRGRLSINQTNLAAWSAVLSGVAVLQADTNNVRQGTMATNFPWTIIQPAGGSGPKSGPSSPLWQLVSSINDVRRTNYSGFFRRLGDVLATPQLAEGAFDPTFGVYRQPFIGQWSGQLGVSDAVLERIPQQILGLLQCDHTPRFVVYSFGQALKPADRAVLGSGLCTNYQITAEVATRSVVHVEGSPNPANTNNSDPQIRYPPRVIIDSFNVLPPD